MLSFDADASEIRVNISTTEDTIFECDESFSATISTEDEDVILCNTTANITIVDDDVGKLVLRPYSYIPLCGKIKRN